VTPRLSILDDYQRVALDCADWAAVQAEYDIDVVAEHLASADDLVERIGGSEVVVAMRERTPFPAPLFERLPALRLLVTTGMKNAAIDVAAARARGVTVCGTGNTGNAVPEITLGMMIALGRNFAAEDASMRRGGWQHTVGTGLSGTTLGVVGLGRLGIPVARLAQAFGMRVTAWSPHLNAERAAEHGVVAVDKATLFAESDWITIHMPLSDRSRGLVGADDLARMKPGAFLVNTSRGPIVDEAALIEVLRAGRIGGAALDVYDTEPLPAHHPLRSMPNTLLLPHIGYVTRDVYRAWFGEVVEDVLAWRAGAPVRVL
jgi:phosphoglycerate dehydrogenase-like enzyme